MTLDYAPICSTVHKEPGSIVAQGCVLTDECDAQRSARFLIYRCGSHWMDWEVHEAAGSEMDGTPIFGEDMRFGPAPCEGSLLLNGMVKWDGCTQWHFTKDGGDHGGWHYDDLVDVPDVRAIVTQVWNLAAKVMPNWSEDVTGWPR